MALLMAQLDAAFARAPILQGTAEWTGATACHTTLSVTLCQDVVLTRPTQHFML
jgi:hypothetical protein